MPNNESVTGSWEVKTKEEIADVSSTGDPCPSDSDSDSGSETPSSPTEPDRPASFSLERTFL